MKPLTNALKKKIQQCRKNKIDIADLIVDVDLKGADLSYCIISNIERTGCDLTGINLSHSIIGGDENKIPKFVKCNLQSANFDSATFLSHSWIRSCNARNANFRHGNFHKVAYEHTDFRGVTFCDSVLKIGTNEAVGALFDLNFFQELVKGSPYEVTLKPKDVN